MKTLIFFVISLFIGFSYGFLYMQNLEQEEQIGILQSKQYLYEQGLLEVATFLETYFNKQ